MCLKYIASGKLLYNTGSPAWCSVMNERAGMRRGGRLKKEEIYNYDLFALIYGRDHHNIVKQLSSNKQTNKQHNLKMGRRPE